MSYYRSRTDLRESTSKMSYWKKPTYNPSQWDKDVLGALRALITDDKIYLDMISTRPGYKRNTIATKLIDVVKKDFPGRKVEHSDTTLDGYRLLKKTGNLAHNKKDGGGEHR